MQKSLLFYFLDLVVLFFISFLAPGFFFDSLVFIFFFLISASSFTLFFVVSGFLLFSFPFDFSFYFLRSIFSFLVSCMDIKERNERGLKLKRNTWNWSNIQETLRLKWLRCRNLPWKIMSSYLRRMKICEGTRWLYEINFINIFIKTVFIKCIFL